MTIHAQNSKVVRVTDPAAIVDNAAFTTQEIDTLGFDYCQIIVYIGATDIAMAALHVTESDTAGSGHAEIVETDFTDATQSDVDGTALAVPSATDDNKFVVFDIDLRKRKRYLDLVATAGDGTTGTYMAAIALLSRADETPVTVAERGALAVVRI